MKEHIGSYRWSEGEKEEEKRMMQQKKRNKKSKSINRRK